MCIKYKVNTIYFSLLTNYDLDHIYKFYVSFKGHMQREKIFSNFDLYERWNNRKNYKKIPATSTFKTTFENSHLRSALYGLSAPYNIACDVTDEPVLAFTM